MSISLRPQIFNLDIFQCNKKSVQLLKQCDTVKVIRFAVHEHWDMWNHKENFWKICELEIGIHLSTLCLFFEYFTAEVIKCCCRILLTVIRQCVCMETSHNMRGIMFWEVWTILSWSIISVALWKDSKN